MSDVPAEFRRFGVVGYGHFGRFLAESLATRGEVLVTDAEPERLPAGPGPVRAAELADVVTADVVVLAIPFGALEGVLRRIEGQLQPQTVVMDVVSTKVRATALLEELLADHPNILATHPLFGPPSMTTMQAGNRIVVSLRRGDRAAGFLSFLHDAFGVQMVEMPAEAHDRAMAYMQSLPFFIARALVDIGIEDLEHRDILAIPSFQKLVEIATIEEQHTVDMFDTSQISNPFAEDARAHFLDVLAKLQREISQHAAWNTGSDR
jgi:prephenate dehydrogenase